jgi:hypothetical protein
MTTSLSDLNRNAGANCVITGFGSAGGQYGFNVVLFSSTFGG